MAAPASVLIFGGSGKVARHLTRLLTSLPDPYTVHSIIRNPDQIPSIKSLGGSPIVASIEDSTVETMTSLIKSSGATTVIWSAGAGGGDPSRTHKVDYQGAVNSMEATYLAGVKRYLIVSAVDVRNKNDPSTVPEWYDDEDKSRSDTMWEKIGSYMQAKFSADRNLVVENERRNLKYTILRPGSLSEEEGTGKISAGKIHISPEIPREDVARTIVEIVKQDAFHCTAFDIVGGETPIADAVAQVVESKVDTFAGRY